MFPQYLQTSDGLKLFVYHWKIDQPKAVVLLIHGIAEHLGRYEHVAKALNEAGYAVVGLDNRTHGKSEGEPRCFVPRFDTFVEDLDLLWAEIKRVYPDLPRFVLGHSMGGHISVRFTLKHQADIIALVTTGVGIMPGESIPQIAITAVKWLGKLTPMLPTTALDVQYISRDPKVVQDNTVDPLVFHEKLRAGMGYSMMSVLDDTNARLVELKLPLFILHGEQDKIVPPAASQKIFEDAASSDKTLKFYPELYHEIMNEPEQTQVLADITAWLDEHLPNR